MEKFRFFFCEKNTTLYFGNSGTLARLLIGILSTTPDIEVISRRSFFEQKKYEKIN